MSERDESVNRFLDWAIHERDFLAEVPGTADRIFSLIPDFLEETGEALTVEEMSDKIRSARRDAVDDPRCSVEELGWPELMRRAALG